MSISERFFRLTGLPLSSILLVVVLVLLFSVLVWGFGMAYQAGYQAGVEFAHG